MDDSVMTSWAQVRAAVDRLIAAGDRVLLGIVGPPGAGKSSLAGAVVRYVGSTAVGVPMDGFHLSDAVLYRLGRGERKGAVDTFDGDGYVTLLARIRAETGRVVYAPAFDRELEQPVAGAIAVAPTARLVVTEGNYLLDREPPWDQVAAELDETWYVHLDDGERRRRLVARHERFGKMPAAALAWEQAVDQPNTERVAAVRDRADRVVDLSAFDLPETG